VIVAMRLRLAIPLMLAQVSCDVRDDPTKMQDAYFHCVKVAELKILQNYPNASTSFSKTRNFSSDPTTNAFEFIWGRADIVSNPPISDLWVMCSGNARSREITDLKISGETIDDLPRRY
jgi:hypothetical protein